MNREYISPEGLRLDGRRPKELRKIECQLGVFTRVDGSAYYEQGNTKVFASVYGPREGKFREAKHDRADVHCEVSVASFSLSERKKYSKQDRRFTELASLLRQTFETVIITNLYPRSSISIHLQVVQNDGAVSAACINAVTLALINAGIPLNCFLCATTVGFIDSMPILDMNYMEKSGPSSPECLVSIDPKSEHVFLMQMDNRLPLANFSEVVRLGVDGCKVLYETLRLAVKDYSFSLKAA